MSESQLKSMLSINVNNNTAIYQGHTDRVLSYVVCPNNNRVVSMGNGLYLWCAKTGQQLAHYQVEEGANYYVTNDESYLIASTFEFYESFDIQKVHLFYIGNDDKLSEQFNKSLSITKVKPDYPIQFLAHVPSGDELVIWQETTNVTQYIYALGDVFGTEEGVLQHQYQISWAEGTLELVHNETQTIMANSKSWQQNIVSMLDVIKFS